MAEPVEPWWSLDKRKVMTGLG
ncbi:protein of unknown function [Cyanobium sp. NIES-981]|nr:protein of unknown function [Cyanobium sp. NIES-981]